MITMSEIARTANANDAFMDGTTEVPASIIESSDLVYGVFSDMNVKEGNACVIIKGERLLGAIARGDKALPIRWTAINVIDYDMAIAARDVLGDGLNERDFSTDGLSVLAKQECAQ